MLCVLSNHFCSGSSIHVRSKRTELQRCRAGTPNSWNTTCLSSHYLYQVLHYTELPAEGDTHTSEDPPPSWPEKGVIEFNNVNMAYREGLPLVLKGVSFNVAAGEKVCIFLLFRSRLIYCRYRSALSDARVLAKVRCCKRCSGNMMHL